jgi:hypothetical protein
MIFKYYWCFKTFSRGVVEIKIEDTNMHLGLSSAGPSGPFWNNFKSAKI